MNLLLLTPADFISAETVRISGRRHRHLLDILRTEPGQTVRVGLLNGKLGEARIVSQNSDDTLLTVALTVAPPPPVPVTLLLAVPRPKALRRLLQGVTALGVKSIVLINSARVDKSYWQSPLLAPEVIEEQLLLGLEQARDTMLPQVSLRPRFRPFVEDELPGLAAGSLCLAAHPEGARTCPGGVAGPVTLAIGPEGGFVPFEIDLLSRQGFLPVHLGGRILRVETAVPALLGRLLQL
jgi:RsmE family RNA methyltransferase